MYAGTVHCIRLHQNESAFAQSSLLEAVTSATFRVNGGYRKSGREARGALSSVPHLLICLAPPAEVLYGPPIYEVSLHCLQVKAHGILWLCDKGRQAAVGHGLLLPFPGLAACYCVRGAAFAVHSLL